MEESPLFKQENLGSILFSGRESLDTDGESSRRTLRRPERDRRLRPFGTIAKGWSGRFVGVRHGCQIEQVPSMIDRLIRF